MVPWHGSLAGTSPESSDRVGFNGTRSDRVDYSAFLV